MPPQDVNPPHEPGDTPPAPPEQAGSEYQLAPSLMQPGANEQAGGPVQAPPAEVPQPPQPAPFEMQQFQPQQPTTQPGQQFGAQFNGQPAQGFGMPPQPAMPGSPMPGGAMPMMPNQMQLNQAYGHDKLAIASLVIGVISLPASLLNLLALPIPILGLVFGFISLKRNKGLALGGIILSAIGFILSIVVLLVGLHLRNERLHPSSSLSGSTASAGTVDTDCFSFQLPAYYSTSDVQRKGACSVMIINSSSSDDISISSLPLPSDAVSDSDKQAVLKAYMDKFTEAAGSALHVGAATLTTFAGQPAYVSTGTEDSATYKYAAGAVILAPRAYDADGESDQVLLIAMDSATATDRMQSLEKSFNWK